MYQSGPLAHPPPATGWRSTARYVRALLSDRVFLLFLLTVATIAALVALPILSDAQRAALGGSYLDPICMTWTVAGCFAGLRQVSDPRERRFWAAIGTGLILWVAVLWLYVVVPPQAWDMRWDVATDTLFLLFYLCLLVAFEIEPHAHASRTRERWERRIRMAGLASLALGWLLYSLLVPAAVLGSRYNEFLPVWIGYSVLDAIIVARLVGLRLTCRNRRWQVLYSALLVAILLQASLDVVDAARAVHVLNQSPDSLMWLLSVLPALGYFAAVRLRQVDPVSIEPGDAGSHQPADRQRSLSMGLSLVLGAFSFPVIHVALESLDLIPPGLDTPSEVVVVTAMLTMASLAVAAYLMFEKRRVVMQREQLELDARFLQAQKMEAVGRLAGGVAHDFNNLLTAIGGYADLARDELPAGAPALEYLAEVRLASDRATALTRQLLAFSRRQLFRPEPILLNRTVRQLEGTMRRLVGTRVKLVTDLAPEAGCISADPGQLEQVLINLVVNAGDAMPDGGTVTISTAVSAMEPDALLAWPEMTSASCVRLQVSDTGVGILPDILPRIFDPFFTTKPSDKGTGLGLATVHDIVRRSGGAITVTSQPGKGSTFAVFFTQIDEAASAADQPEARQAPVGAGTILLVEDEVAVRNLARSMLERCGYTVLTASCGDDAIEMHESYQGAIDLLLTDVVMPGISGRILAERLTARQANLRVLFMTGYTDDAVVQHGVLEGGVALLPKPFTREALSEAVRAVFDRPPAGVQTASSPKRGGRWS
jgi:signal transduction histidine kinase/CheY-like chemotaxis protein